MHPIYKNGHLSQLERLLCVCYSLLPLLHITINISYFRPITVSRAENEIELHSEGLTNRIAIIWKRNFKLFAEEKKISLVKKMKRNWSWQWMKMEILLPFSYFVWIKVHLFNRCTSKRETLFAPSWCLCQVFADRNFSENWVSPVAVIPSKGRESRSFIELRHKYVYNANSIGTRIFWQRTFF